jgi:hypothetical protein
MYRLLLAVLLFTVFSQEFETAAAEPELEEIKRLESIMNATAELINIRLSEISREIENYSKKEDHSEILSEITGQIMDLRVGVSELAKEFDFERQIKLTVEKNASDSYARAVKLVQTEQYSLAGIYFTNALALTPDNLTILNDYTNSVLAWVEIKRKQQDFDTAKSVLNNYMRFLYTYQGGLDIKGADYIASTFKTISDFYDSLAKQAESWQLIQAQKDERETEQNIVNIATSPIPEDEESLIKQFRDLQLLLVRWQSIAPEGVQTIEEITNRQRILTDNLEAISLLGVGEKALKAGKPTDNITAYYAANELYLTNQRLITLKPNLSPKLAMRVERFSRDLNAMTGNMANDAERGVWNLLDQKRRQEVLRMAASAKTKEDAVRVWNNFAEDVSIELARAQNPVFASNMRKLLQEIAKQIATLKDEQMTLYEKWALNQLKTMYSEYNAEIGVLGGNRAAKERIYSGLADYLCHIDTRYLSVTALKIYNDIHDFFSKELDRGVRLNLAEEFNKCRKRELSTF